MSAQTKSSRADGRPSPLWTALPSWVLYPAGLVPAVYYIYSGVTNTLGPDPISTLENALGEWALIFMVIGLAISPIQRIFRVNLVKYRRAIGLVAFAYVTLHLSTYVGLDRQFVWSEIWTDIMKRPYITIGTASFLMLLPLAITSNNASVRKMGAAAWRNLHKLTYPAALLGAIHYVLLAKTWQAEPLFYLTVITALLIWRFARKKSRNSTAGNAGN
ncbi:MAG: protein-methionine-sulfoxide reductase heme-binding subunit MsrQ [Pseudomonadota bacterium]